MATTDSNGLVLLQQTDNLTPLEGTINTVTSSVSAALNANTRIFQVANQAARDTLANSRTPTANNPLFVWRQDTKEMEYNYGTGWGPFPPVPDPDIITVTGSTVIRNAAVATNSGFNGSINFGKTFAARPVVVATLSNARLNLSVETITTTGFTYGARNDSGTTTLAGDVVCMWIAVGKPA